MTELTIDQALQQGIEAHKAGQVQEAYRLYRFILKAQPNQPDANHNMGVLAVGGGKVEQALPFLKTALEASPSTGQFWLSYIDALIKLERLAEAKAVFDNAKSQGAKGDGLDQLEQRLNVPTEAVGNNLEVEQVQPNAKQSPSETVINQLASLFNQGQLDTIIQQTEALIKHYPNNFVIWSFMGGANLGLGQAAKAAKAFSRVTQLNPNYPEGHNNLGSALQKLGRYEESLKCFRNALSLNPDYSDAYYNIGISCKELSKLDLAIESFELALALNPTNWKAYGNIGVAFKDKSEWAEAVVAYRKALAINPNDPELISNMGNALKEQGKLEEALEAYNKALSLKPDYAEAYYNMGATLKEQCKLEEALEAYNKALSLKPDYADAYNNMGIVLQDQGKPEEAIEAYNKALAIKPDYADAYNNMGVVLQNQGKPEEAIEAYNKVLAIRPDYARARAQKLHQLEHICDWDAIREDRNLIPSLGTSDEFVPPFSMLSLEDAPERHRLRSETFAKANYPQKPLPLPAKPSKKPKRLRIGYFSSDFGKHPVTYLITKMFALHDREKFEIFAYSFGGQKENPWRQKVIDAVDVFTDVTEMSSLKIALLARRDEIDIAIDLNGLTKNSRLSIFAYRAAPIQMSYLGIAMTTGADFIDYLIADRICIPSDMESCFSESIMHLPNCYQVNDNSTVISNVAMSRSEMGLPENGFVFCCFNQSFKITQNIFDIWMRVLRQVDGSVLWLQRSNEWAEQNLRKEANKRGVAGDRLIFADRLPLEKHLARHKLADLFLDTFNFNAGATASAALWAGLPLVTKMGKGFVTRVSGSMLSAIGLDEMITKTEQEYEALILDLAINSQRLLSVKQKLISNRLSTPLFDTKLFTRHMEKGYTLAYQNYYNGMEPRSLIINGANVL